MKTIRFILLPLFLCSLLSLYVSTHLPAQRIYTVAGGTGNGCKLTTGVVGFPVYMTFDKKNNIYATCYDLSVGAIGVRKYDFENDITTTVAGNDTFGKYKGDGMPATQVPIADYPYWPTTLAFDENENLLITARWQHCIRRVNRKGIINTIAGTGKAGFSGDGGAAKNAQLNNPMDIALDKAGNLYIADMDNWRIRKVSRNGVITTFAGNGSKEYNGDSIFAKDAGMVPEWITIDKQNNLYVFDFYNKRIRRIDTSGRIYNVAGNGHSSAFYPPDTSIALRTPIDYITNIITDNKKNLYLVFSFNVYKVSPDGLMTRFAGGGTADVFTDNIPATDATFSEPEDLAFDKFGNLYITAGYYITKVDSNNILHNVLGPGATNDGSALKEAPRVGNIAINPFTDSAYLFESYTLYAVDRQKGTLNRKAGGTYGNSGDSGLALNASFQSIQNLCFDKDGNTYIADEYSNVIRKIDKKGIIYTVAGTGGAGFTGDGKPATKSRLNHPTGVAVDSKGNLYIADNENNRVRKVDTATQIITTVAGNGSDNYSGDGGPATAASIWLPQDLAFDTQENLYIADSRNRRIRRVDQNGIITTFAGNGTVKYAGEGLATQKSIGRPDDLLFDRNGNLYICDGYNAHVYKVDTLNRLTLYAGRSDGSLADGIVPTEASIGYAKRIALDATQNFYTSDGSRVREIYTECNGAHAAERHALAYRYVNAPAFLGDGCNLICSLSPTFNVTNGLNSLVSSEVWIADSVIKAGANFLVQRHYQLWSVVQPRAAKSTVTLYFTQSEFDAYNSAAASRFTPLPRNRNDTAGVSNLRIIQYKDSLADGNTLLPPSQTQTLNPDDENIIWNDTLNSWQVTLDATGLGNFYLTTTASSLLMSKVEVAEPALYDWARSISIYPNPAHDKVTVVIPQRLLHTYLQLTAQDGRVILSTKLTGRQTEFNVQNLATGLYLFTLSDGTFGKFIKE